jgi:hypothetical protein
MPSVSSAQARIMAFLSKEISTIPLSVTLTSMGTLALSAERSMAVSMACLVRFQIDFDTAFQIAS